MNSALRFALLRTICVFSIALLFTVPSMIVSYDTTACRTGAGAGAALAARALPNSNSGMGQTLPLPVKGSVPAGAGSVPAGAGFVPAGAGLSQGGGVGFASSDFSQMPIDPDIQQYEVHRIVYSYVLYGFTLLHHFTRWALKHYMYVENWLVFFCTVPSVRHFVCGISSTSPWLLEKLCVSHFATQSRSLILQIKNAVFTSQSASGRSAFFLPLPRDTLSLGTVTCKVPYSYLGITPVVSAFSWVAAISLGLLTCVRVAEVVKSEGRAERRPDALKVLFGVNLWEAHFEFVV